MIADGGYVMLCAAKTTLAVDTQGATNNNGANVRLYTRNDSDGQLVTVQTYGNYQVIRFPLTGMVVDVSGARVAQGQNVMQHTWNQGKNQQWQIDATGSSYTVGGTSYPGYKVKTAMNTGYELEAYGSASSVAKGTNLDIARSSSDLDHVWLFVPAPILQAGRAYRLLSASDHNVAAGLSGNSGDVQVKLVGSTDSNWQRWMVTNSYPNVKVSPLSNSKLFMAPKGYAAANSVPVNVLKDSSDQSVRWYPTIVGSQTLNGQQFPLVTFRNLEGVNLVMDVKGASTAVGTNLQVYTSNGNKCQKFLAIPETALDTALPAASKLGITYGPGYKAQSAISGNGSSIKAWLSWLGTANDWELRYRTQYRDASKGQSDWGGWSAWKSIQGNATAGLGWGTGENATCIPTKERDSTGAMRNYSRALTFGTLSGDGQDAVRIQWEVRQWASRSSAYPVNRHGNVATATNRIVWRPTCTISSALWSTDGLRLVYSTDQLRGGNKMTISRIATTISGEEHVIHDEDIVMEGLSASGSVTIPQDVVGYLFNEGDPITVKAKWSNADGAGGSCDYSGTVAYDTGKTSIINAPTITPPSEANGWMLHVSATGTVDSAELYLDYGSTRTTLTRYEDDGNLTWDVPVRYGESYDVYILAKSGSTWDKYQGATMPAVDNPYRYVCNFANDGEQGCFVIHGNAGSPPTFSLSYDADVDAQMTNGTTYEVVHYGFGRKASGQLSGVYVPVMETMHTSTEQLQALMAAGYAWLRDESKCYRIAVTGYELTKTPAQWDEVSVSFRLINEPDTY